MMLVACIVSAGAIAALLICLRVAWLTATAIEALFDRPPETIDTKPIYQDDTNDAGPV